MDSNRPYVSVGDKSKVPDPFNLDPFNLGMVAGIAQGVVNTAIGMYTLATTNPLTSTQNMYEGVKNIPQSVENYVQYTNDPNVSDFDKAKAGGEVAFGLFAMKGVGKSVVSNVSNVTKASNWVYGSFKSQAKWESQFQKRGWTPKQITEAIRNGRKYDATNNVNKNNSATRYVHPKTKQSVVIDNKTKEILHVGGKNFKY